MFALLLAIRYRYYMTSVIVHAAAGYVNCHILEGTVHVPRLTKCAGAG
jgi:hypothetical protein